jgi:hypothetical protein
MIAAPACASINLTQSTGETYIKWTWNDPSSALLMVYVDGVFVKNATSQYYYLSGLKSMEEHRIDLYTYNQTKATATGGTLSSPDQIGDLVGTKTTSTTLNSGLFYILLILLIALTVVTALIQNPVKGALLGIFSSLLALALSIIAGFFMDWLILLSIITGVLAVIFTILHGQQIMKNSYFSFSWW